MCTGADAGGVPGEVCVQTHPRGFRPDSSWRRHALRVVRNLPCDRAREATTVAQRIIELLIGRLITDERFRDEFLAAPEATLLQLADQGLDLSRIEIAALVNTDRALWARAAAGLDPRLQKVSLVADAAMS